MNKPIVDITGASSGIGLATAKRLASEGYALILNARRQDRLDEIARVLHQEYGAQCLVQCFDVRVRAEVEKAIASLPEEWRNIDVLVNNAGLAMGMSSIEEGNIDDWEVMIDTNIKGLLYMTRTILPIMIANNKGHIVNIGSIAGKETYPNGNVYCATKTAVDALNKSMRIDLVKYPIKVTAVNPGAVETEFSVVRFKGDIERANKVYEGFENLIGEDVADAISYVISRPPHVNINDLIIMPVAQAQAGIIHRKA
ncbi:MAG: SDR family oxidoreductase [Ignavibacteriae bacterium]|nr:SDR family oxidoreductase [Ignavibacteriota bacterium]